MRLTLKEEVTKKGHKLPTGQELEFYVSETKRILAKVPESEDVWIGVKRSQISTFVFEPKEIELSGE
jgi:hypothetical protein